MPHCVIECSADLARHPAVEQLVQAVHDAANRSGLFQTADIKTRLLASPHYLVGGAKADFVHLSCLILEGRNDEQKGRLADALVRAASAVLPEVAAISCEVRDMDPAAYAKRAG
ncbi:5-carboxymethyl-2-hydroxymuconate isomerase [Chromobacterium sinusclupearum]|uniref:5-carboxymethyl-2-hydroxymuconate isomerase n=1 Tax=Chromobacterium sinusclupearum TaxID=2077146 RepID=A0A2K4MKR6_9NEIS|nr:5-carboxymethyl-2-hydroxymuconate Delta-isomerase [Chromobacterium sinusclupearum]POA97345.1 5-carboxymethyl-2-hydroxymuconate isomerase [Chromobacterium sinusclupearum]